MDRKSQPAQQHTPRHDPRTCSPCGFLRHPAQAAKGRALTAHLKTNPFPRQAVTS